MLAMTANAPIIESACLPQIFPNVCLVSTEVVAREVCPGDVLVHGCHGGGRSGLIVKDSLHQP